MKKELTPTEYEKNLHDITALLAMTGLLMRSTSYDLIIPSAFNIADEFMQARKERTPQSGA